MNKHINYLFFILNKFIHVSQYVWTFSEFSDIFGNNVFDQKYQVYNRENASSITRNSSYCDLESFYKNISEIRNVASIIQKFEKIQKIFQNREKKLKKFTWISKNQWIHLKHEKYRLTDYLLDDCFFYQFINNFAEYIIMQNNCSWQLQGYMARTLRIKILI